MINTKCGLKKYGRKTKKFDKKNTCLSENTLQLKYMEIIQKTYMHIPQYKFQFLTNIRGPQTN